MNKDRDDLQHGKCFSASVEDEMECYVYIYLFRDNTISCLNISVDVVLGSSNIFLRPTFFLSLLKSYLIV